MTPPNPLPSPLRDIRRVEPPDAPWAGTLAEEPCGRQCLLVDVEELHDDIAWQGGVDGHLAAIRDLVRTPTGHAAILPLCARPLDAFLRDRQAGGTPLLPGEIVTLAVSLLRGIAELAGLGAAAAPGRWWVDDDGRPVLVGGGREVARDATAVLLREIDAEGPVAEALRFASEVLADPRRTVREAADVEASLFAAATPAPLATAALAPLRAHRIAAGPAPESDTAAVPSRWWEALVPHVDAALPDMASHVAMRLWRRLRADRPRRSGRPGRRSRPIAVAAVLGAIVVAVGLLWPQGSDAPAVAEPRHPGPAPTASRGHPGPAPTASRGHPGPAPTASIPTPHVDSSLEKIATGLLQRRAECSDDACVSATQEDPSAEFTGSADGPGENLTLLDDYGGAAVLRADGRDGTARLVVMVRADGKWLLRDIRNVAEQPER